MAPDVTVVVTGHGEGALAEATFEALARSVRGADGVAVEVVGVLDRADDATTAVFERALAPDGVVGAVAAGRTVATDHGDPGAARNHGVRLARAPWVCVLDADNLPSGSWLREAHRVAAAHGSPCVVHPEQLVIFGERWQVWPQPASADPSFSVHNFFDRTYWDTFCLTARDVFVDHPYAATDAGRGLGPEDWHWGMVTVHAGVPHLSAPGTWLLYRDKASGSVQGGHTEARSLLPPTDLLTDVRLATSVPEPARAQAWRGLQREVLLAGRGDDAGDERRPRGWRARLARRRTDRAPAPSSAGEDPADDGPASALRARLGDDELVDLGALDLDDYAALHPDLAGMDDDALVHHYLAHGRAEGRAASRGAEERDADRPVAVADALAAELTVLHALDPDVPEPTVDALARLRRTGPPSDGSVTRGSRAWWRVVDALGSSPVAGSPLHIDALVLVPGLGDDEPEVASTLAGLGHGRVAVVGTSAPCVRPSWLDPSVAVVGLSAMPEWRQLPAPERTRLLATLVVQTGAAEVHVLGSAEGAAAVEAYALTLGSLATVRVR